MSAAPLRFGPAVPSDAFREIQTRMALDFCKWDSQVGDRSTLFPQPLLLSSSSWLELRHFAESLSAELFAAEQELLHRPDLLPILNLPAQFRSILRSQTRRPSPSLIRIMRFDFHLTSEGWRISEVNSDVPGGYTEASRFTSLMSQQFPDAHATRDPAAELVRAISSVVRSRASIALLSAPGFLEDQQVTAFLAGRLQGAGINTLLLHTPSQLRWKAGTAFASARGGEVQLDGIIRFYQGEWLAKLPKACGWPQLFFEGHTPITNPAASLLTESKRFALAWSCLSSKMRSWQALLPECRDPREGVWQTSDAWVVKAAFSNTGDEVHLRDAMDARSWSDLCRTVGKSPERWVVQRRFHPMAVASCSGPMYPCIGVYTVNGRAAGVYARASSNLVTNYAASDVALLVDDEQYADEG